VLTNTTYLGEHIFNKANWKTGIEKPEDEWVRIPNPQIISEDLFELVQQKLHSRNREISHPRRISSPRLLTGVLKCGTCGASMVLATGKNNQYRYYKCSNRIRKCLDMCDSKPVSMEMLDEFVINAVLNQALSLERVAAMLTELKQRMRSGGGTADLKSLVRQLEAIKARVANMYDAIEKGAVSIDDMLKDRLDALRKQKTEVEHKIDNYCDSPQATMDAIDNNLVKTFCDEARKKLSDPSSKFTKEYLQLLVSEIVVTGDEVKIKGNYSALVGAVKFSAKKKNLSTKEEVLRFNQEWRPLPDLNRCRRRERAVSWARLDEGDA
jgi:site-specific DNA recombinase